MVKILGQCDAFLVILLGPPEEYPSIYEINPTIDALEGMSVWICKKLCFQPEMPADLVRLIQTGFNEIFWQVFVSALTV